MLLTAQLKPRQRPTWSPGKPVIKTDTFRSPSGPETADPRWAIARIRQSLPSQVERTNLTDLHKLLDERGLGRHKQSLSKAYEVARKAHAGVTREEGTPYIHHPARVCATLIKTGGITDIDVLNAALLHDVVEDSPLTVSDIKHQFGGRTAGFVELLTKPSSSAFSSKEECNRFQAQRLAAAPREVRMVKVADRLDNVGDLHLLPPNGKMSRYLKDTRENYLPLAQDTSDALHAALQLRVCQLERLDLLQQIQSAEHLDLIA